MMTAQEIVIAALQFYNIEIIAVNGNHIKVQHQFEIEVEANGLYKLTESGYTIAPFDDVNELCRFILL